MPQSLCLVFYVQGKVDGRKKLSSLLKKKAQWVTFNPLGEIELVRWIRQSFRGYQKEVSPEVAQELAFIVGNDGTTLRQEIEKIAAFVGENTTVTHEDIKEAATPSLEYSIFDLVDAVVGGNQEKTFLLKKQLLEQGGDAIGILAMLLRQYRILFFAKGMTMDKKRKEDIRQTLGIPSFALDRALKQGQPYTLEALKKGMEICIQRDYQIKSGQIPWEGALDQAIFSLRSLEKNNDR